MTIAIEVKGLVKVYDGKVRALDGVDLKVKAGNVFALLRIFSYTPRFMGFHRTIGRRLSGMLWKGWAWMQLRTTSLKHTPGA